MRKSVKNCWIFADSVDGRDEGEGAVECRARLRQWTGELKSWNFYWIEYISNIFEEVSETREEGWHLSLADFLWIKIYFIWFVNFIELQKDSSLYYSKVFWNDKEECFSEISCKKFLYTAFNINSFRKFSLETSDNFPSTNSRLKQIILRM